MTVGPHRVAGAPITWGVCEVPGWGHQMEPHRVLAEMRQLGLSATEAGPDGFLPNDPGEARALLDRHGMRLAAGFVPVVLHDERRWAEQRRAVAERVGALSRAGADTAVIAASTGDEAYEGSRKLDAGGWDRLARSLTELGEDAERAGVSLTVHPHYGTVIESPEQIERFLDASDVPLCLDTGHVMVGGGDPVQLTRQAAGRIEHVHLKDVDAELASRVRAGEISYHQATASGLYRVLGEGDVDIAAIVQALDGEGFEGWWVLEHDVVLSEEPPAEGGPRRDARASLHHLESVAAAVRAGEPHR